MFELANSEVKQKKEHPRIRPFSEYLADKATKLAAHTIRSEWCDPVRLATLKYNSAEPCLLGTRRIGRPREMWADKQYTRIWNEAKLSTTQGSARDNTYFNRKRGDHYAAVYKAALDRRF